MLLELKQSYIISRNEEIPYDETCVGNRDDNDDSRGGGEVRVG